MFQFKMCLNFIPLYISIYLKLIFNLNSSNENEWHCTYYQLGYTNLKTSEKRKYSLSAL